MKKLLLPALLIPSVAMAGMVIVDDGSTAQQPVSSAQHSPIDIAPGIVLASPSVAVGVPSNPVGSNIEPLWIASAGSTLRESIQKWANEAKWTLVWDAPDGVDKSVNYPIVAPLRFQGQIDVAVGNCIRLYEHAKKPLGVEINRSQRLLYVHLKYN